MQGVFCGDCLFMRYGENIKEANAKADWVCPPCRGEQRFCDLCCTTGESCWRQSPLRRADICNCSIHRIRKGWAPTGSMYRQAIAAGEDRPPFAVRTGANAAILANILFRVGFKSVAHYIILNNVAKPENENEPAKAASKKHVSSQEPGTTMLVHPNAACATFGTLGQPCLAPAATSSAADKELHRPQAFSLATAQPFTQLQITNMLPQKRRRASNKAVGKGAQNPEVGKAVGLEEGCKRATRSRAGKIMRV